MPGVSTRRAAAPAGTGWPARAAGRPSGCRTPNRARRTCRRPRRPSRPPMHPTRTTTRGRRGCHASRAARRPRRRAIDDEHRDAGLHEDLQSIALADREDARETAEEDVAGEPSELPAAPSPIRAMIAITIVADAGIEQDREDHPYGRRRQEDRGRRSPAVTFRARRIRRPEGRSSAARCRDARGSVGTADPGCSITICGTASRNQPAEGGRVERSVLAEPSAWITSRSAAVSGVPLRTTTSPWAISTRPVGRSRPPGHAPGPRSG